MKTKVLEVRDSGTFMPALAISFDTEQPDLVPQARYLLRRAGWGHSPNAVGLLFLEIGEFQDDRFKWGESRRTYFNAHRYIAQNFHLLHDGDVVDVQFILGETATPKASESMGVY